MCGLVVKAGVVFVGADNEDELAIVRDSYTQDDLQGDMTLSGGFATTVIDMAPLHERCAKLTEAHCPVIKRKLREGTAWIRPYKRDA